MQLFLGDRLHLVKGDTIILAKNRGIVLDAHGKIERVYVDELEMAFWVKDGWKLGEEDEEFFEIDEDEEDEI
jgi:hypothetical protein